MQLSFSQRSILVKQLSVSQLCDFLKYRNDISFHEGEHYCSRSCEGAIFLCGNSYHNSRGNVTKCDHISYSASGIFHECQGPIICTLLLMIANLSQLPMFLNFIIIIIIMIG